MELRLTNVKYTSQLYEQLCEYPDTFNIQGVPFKVHQCYIQGKDVDNSGYCRTQWYDIYLELEEIG
jgi:hypothetical protein